jgi:hypothetical protein
MLQCVKIFLAGRSRVGLGAHNINVLMTNNQEHRVPKRFFEDNIAHLTGQYRQAAHALQKATFFRVLVLLLGLVGVVFFANAGSLSGTLMVAGTTVVVLVLLQKKRNVLTRLKEMAALYLAVNRDEVARSSLDLKDLPGGQSYIDPKHPYGPDLDIVGGHSLFALLNRTTTAFGRNKLAAWLLHPADGSVVSARQRAVQELTGKPQWRQQMEVAGRYQQQRTAREGLLSAFSVKSLTGFSLPRRKAQLPDEEAAMGELRRWLSEPDAQVTKYRFLYRVALLVLPATFIIGNVGLLLAMAGNEVGILSARTWLLLTGLVYVLDLGILRGLQVSSLRIGAFGPPAATALRTVAALDSVQEKERFESSLLSQLQGQLRENGGAGAALGRLVKVLENVGQMRDFGKVVMLTEVNWLLQGEALKKEITPARITAWTDAVGELEALNSLAGFSYAHPEYPFPRIAEAPYHFEARALGHPLIPAAKRVTNDFTLNGQGAIALVTGSNMAGKSTFLRTVGINTTLALAGAPVCAADLEVSVVQLYTSMRTHDELAESTSSFMAELLRINGLLRLLKTNRVPGLFLLDEILKGTNSADRHAGAEALARQLSRQRAFGMLSTHDLELVSLSDEMDLVNYSFESDIVGDQIRFDYKLRDGPCRTANAAALMRQLGIGV